MSRGAAVAAVCLAVLMVSTVATPALAAVAPTEADPSPQVNGSAVSGGPFDISELRRGGTQPSAAPPSVRYVGSGGTTDGAVAVRYQPADPLSNDPVYLDRGETLNTDEIELYSTLFGGSTGEYELVIVYWQAEQAEANGSTVEYAANQEVQRATVTLEDGYATAPVALNSHYDASWQATMWLERGGERIEGARWRFEHASAPASQQVAIDTQADAWWYSLRTAILPGLASIVVGLSAARATLRRTGRGPGYSLGVYGFLTVVGGLMAAAGLYYEVATVVSNLEIIMGLSLLPVAYGGGLRMSPPTEKIAFERKELRDAVSLRRGESDTDPEAVADGGSTASERIELEDDDYFDELYEDMSILTTVRAPDGGRLLPKTGIRPFFARMFAKAAKLDLSDLKTRVRVEGSAEQKVYVDPEADEAVRHRPARLRRRMPVWHRLPVPDEDETLSSVTRALYGALTVATLALPAIGWYAGDAVANVQTVGAIVGVALLATESYEAVDGAIDFDPAPRHDITADASLTILQSEHSDATLIDELEDIAWEERSRNAIDARQIEKRRNKTIVQSLSEGELGMGLDIIGLDGNAGTDADEFDIDGDEAPPEASDFEFDERAEADDD